MIEFTNYIPENNLWQSISQPDGFIYFHTDFFRHLIDESASEAGLSTGALASEGKTARMSRLTAYYQLIRAYGGGHPWVGTSYYSGSFNVRNVRSGDCHKFRLVPIPSATLGANLEDLETQRMRNPVLQSIRSSRSSDAGSHSARVKIPLEIGECCFGCPRGLVSWGTTHPKGKFRKVVLEPIKI